MQQKYLDYHEGQDDELALDEVDKDFSQHEAEVETEMQKDLAEDGFSDGEEVSEAQDTEPAEDSGVGTSLSMYMKEVAAVGDYTPDQLIAKIQKMHEVYESGDTQKALRLRNDIVEHNLKLVISAAKHYRYGYTPSQFSDAIQAGNEGLIHAVSRFDPSRGYRFSTYAWWWIRQSISRTANETMSTVRVSSGMAEDIAKAKKLLQDMEKGTGRAAVSYIAKKLGWTPKHAREVIQYANMQNVGSLNALVSGKSSSSDSETEIGEMVQDPNGNFTDTVDKRMVEGQLGAVLDKLPSKRTADIIKRYYGLEPYPAPQTLEEIGAEYSVSHQAIQRALKNGLSLLNRKPELHDALALLDIDDV